MKTIREYIEKLDEISRRDFLKGATSASIIPVLGVPAKASALGLSQTEENMLTVGLDIVWVCNNPNYKVNPKLCSAFKTALVEWWVRTGYDKQALNDLYATINHRNFNEVVQKDQKALQYFEFISRETVISQWMQGFKSARPFESLEETSTEAIEKINQLQK